MSGADGADGVGSGWPTAHLDPIARLRVLAAALPGTVTCERVVDAPFDDVWGFVADLEVSAPTFDRDVSRLRIVRRDGERLRVHSWAPFLPVPLAFDVTLRPGWCWMVSTPRLYVVGMAAVPDGDRTRFASLEGLVVQGPRAARAVASPLLALSRWRHRRHVPRDQDAIEREALARRRPPTRP